ncbi:MAG TPA: phosphoesterase, partial [Candidatus Glassbacteria bacterium]|nr:phosphoesterase [Candidatus Glassbacteria bacterium]
FGIKCVLVYGGEIGRAENQALVRLLKIPARQIESVRIGPRARFAVVDTQPGSRNHSLPEGARVVLTFDHHPPNKRLKSAFSHVCEELGATSTMLFEYLQLAGVEISSRLATALAYALISETQDLGREARRNDVLAYQKLIARASLRTLAEIKYPVLSHDYFQTLNRALNNTYFYRNIVVTRLGAVNSTDMIHQMADLFLRFERRSWSLAIGWNQSHILLSLRSSNVRARCGKMILRLVKGKGTAGGHDMVAGGRVDCRGMNQKEIRKVEELIISRFLLALGHSGNLDILAPLVDDEGEGQVEAG